MKRLACPVVLTATLGAIMAAGASAAPARAASPEVVAQLQAMNDADCTTTKSNDWAAYAKTLAPEYVGIGPDGSKDGREATLVDLNKNPSRMKVTGCSTKVTAVTQVGDQFMLYGVYSEEGTYGPKHAQFRIEERIRDTWRRANGAWLQTESLSYEAKVWQSGKLVSHEVLKATT